MNSFPQRNNKTFDEADTAAGRFDMRGMCNPHLPELVPTSASSGKNNEYLDYRPDITHQGQFEGNSFLLNKSQWPVEAADWTLGLVGSCL